MLGVCACQKIKSHQKRVTYKHTYEIQLILMKAKSVHVNVMNDSLSAGDTQRLFDLAEQKKVSCLQPNLFNITFLFILLLLYKSNYKLTILLFSQLFKM